MPKNERILDFDDPRERARVAGAIYGMRGKWRFTMTRYRPRRSDAQNRRYWGLLVPAVRDGLMEAWGESMSTDQVHEFLKTHLLSEPVVNRNTGEIMGHRAGSSAALNTAEFVEYSDKVERFASEYLGVEVPQEAMV